MSSLSEHVPAPLNVAAGFACSVHIGMHEGASGFLVAPGVVLTSAHWLGGRAQEAAFMCTVPGLVHPFHDGPDESRSCLAFAGGAQHVPDVAVVFGSTLRWLYRTICARGKCEGNPATSGDGEDGVDDGAVLAVVTGGQETGGGGGGGGGREQGGQKHAWSIHSPSVAWATWAAQPVIRGSWLHQLPPVLADVCSPSSVGGPVLCASNNGVQLVGLVAKSLSAGYSYVPRDCIDLLLRYVPVKQMVLDIERVLTMPSLSPARRTQLSARRDRLSQVLAQLTPPPSVPNPTPGPVLPPDCSALQ